LARLSLLAVACLALVSPLAAQADPEQLFVDALATDKLLVKGQYKAVRAVMADYFEKKYAADLKAGFGDDFDAITKFLKDNPDLRETLFCALDPEVDQFEEALKLFRELYKLGPDKLKAHAELAVAVCVVWDDPKAVYDYRGHARRTRSTLPTDPLTVGWKENYQYLLSREGELKGVVQNLPWEFLVHMVNNRTPVGERDWAVKNYIKKRAGIGGVYKEIVYDKEMLRTEQRNGGGKGDCRLTDQDYTLEGIKKYGGVCAMQADFAARVAKSIAVPAEYVRGEGNSGGLHAWVMWVELKAVTKDKIEFALLSEGRYFGDQFYVGTLEDPKSGRETTDRDLERRLVTIGVAPQHARQADLLMRMYPYVKEKKEMPPKQRLAFVKKMFEIFPHCERAWVELADIAKDGKTIEPPDAVNLANRALTAFAGSPDFSWSLFDAILTSQKDKTQRGSVFEKAVLKYEALGRPDLACECRIKWAEYVEDAKDYKKAAEGLAQTITKFPAEGRYVPRVLDKLADVCSKYKDGTKKLAKFYLEFLPRVPKTRGDEVTAYAVKVHEQAHEFFKKNNMTKEAAQVEAVLTPLKRAKPGKP
jgi:tetratricopeptide (TPR) repeat protein